MTIEASLTILAIFLGPLIAVLITYGFQRNHEVRQRRMLVFRSLMTTRRTPLSAERVQALNLVEVEFYGNKSVQDKFASLLETYNDQVRWKSDNDEVRNAVIQEVDDRTAKLLQEMGKVLGFKLENLDLLRGGYYPEAFSILEKQQFEIREFLAGLNRGSKVLPTAVIDVRHPEQLLAQAREAQELIVEAERAEKGQ